MRSYPAHYCVPHVKVPGSVILTPGEAPKLLVFQPDTRNPHVREFGADAYKLRVEACDILECGAVEMPLEEGLTEPGPIAKKASRGHAEAELGIAHFLQLQVRTLDGMEYCTPQEAEKEPLFVTFRMTKRQELFEAARTLLAVVPEAQEALARLEEATSGGLRSTTNIPFPCLDSLAECEAAAHQKRRKAAEEAAVHASHQRAVGRPVAVGPLPPSDIAASPSSASSSPHLEKVTLRKPDQMEGWDGRTLLTPHLAESISEYLPIGLRLPGAVEWVLRYTPKAHGVSMETLYRNMAEHEKSILILQDSGGHIFGGFAPCAWMPHGLFYGSGEAFVFTFGHLTGGTDAAVEASAGGAGSHARRGRPPEHMKPLEMTAYSWSTRNSFIMFSDHEVLGMGGGDGKHAFAIRNDLLRGLSHPTATFGNPPLASAEDFVVVDIELWAIEEVGVG